MLSRFLLIARSCSTISSRTMSKYCSFYVSLPDKPVYLTARKSERIASLTTERSSALARFSKLYVIDTLPLKIIDESEDETLRESLYVQSCISTQDLFSQLVEQEKLSGYDFVLGTKQSISGSDVRRQLYAFQADDAQSVADDSVLNVQNHDVWAYEKESEWSWKLKDFRIKGTAKTMPQILEETDQIPEVSPIFRESCFSPVFHDYERAMKILHMYQDCKEVQQLCKIAAQELSEQHSLSQLVSMMKHPLVVVEGMDATGKTTLTQFLEEKLKAARYSTPPPCLLPLRRFFDRLPEIVRRAYYSLGNYIVAQQIATECQTRAVVMDRYWHSTTAYGIANETSYEDLPPPGHRDYYWPDDLLKPSAVIFLTVTEQVRRERLGNRHDNSVTFEERNLNKDQLFRKRLCESYLRMRDPACIPVDASGGKEEVVEAVLKELKLQGIHLT